MPEAHDVVVIGAGMAGLACVQKLTEASTDLLLLEAANRVGGRVRTDFAVGRGLPCEIGAFMIHGKRVITHEWMREFGLHARSLPTMRRARFWCNGRVERLPLPGNIFHRTIGLRAFYQGGISLPRKLKEYDGPDLSLGEFLKRERVLPGARSIVELLYAHLSAANADDVGVRGPGSEAALADEEFFYTNFHVVEGYEALLSGRMTPLRDHLRLKTRVTSIHRSRDGVRLEAEVNGASEEFLAKRAVVTLPLGILKADAVAFDPPLPEDKQEAIRRIAFGDVIVVALRLRGGNLVDRLGDFGVLYGRGASSFHRLYVGIRNPPPILSAFTSGREARRRAALDDEGVVQATLEELKSILPAGVDPGEVEDYAIARWTHDPFVRGGYSYLPIGADLRHRLALAAPVDGVLFFAGEATHTAGEPATVHGAIETGYRAAQEVAQSLQPVSTTT
jgi:monoamine oxidase